MTNMRNGLKALGAVLVIVALCAPLMFWPLEDPQPSALGLEKVTVTVPPTVVVATTIPGLESTTTTTEPPREPAPSTTSTSTTTTTGPIDITVAAVGDVLTPDSILQSVKNPETGGHEFGAIFAPVVPYLSGTDYTVAALGPRLAGTQVAYGLPLAPNAPQELAFALRAAGIDLVATANNHSLDLGWEGVVGTLDRLDAAGLAHVGTARSSKERRTPVVVDIRGIKVAFLNYTDSVAGQFPVEEPIEEPVEEPADEAGAAPAGQPADEPAGKPRDYAVNLLSLDTVTEDAMTARSWGADAVIAMLDYGTEYAGEPSPQQVELSQQILNRGVDAILGSSARVAQSIGHIFTYASWRTNDKYVAYSLGSFLSTSQPDRMDSGLIAYLHLQKRDLRTYVTGVSYLPLYVQASGTQTPASPDSTSTTLLEERPVAYRILPVMPGLEPDTDVALTDADRQRMAQIWNETRELLYRPDENISPLVLSDLIGL
jgi:poly-gamma-glutamate synthesis protein (capsule biosynthesis protein)